MLRGLLLLVLGAAAAIAAERVLLDGPVGAPPRPADSEPQPGDPPLVWVEGTIEELDASHLEVREGEGEALTLERLAAGATAFLRAEGDAWRELGTAEVDALGAGEPACIESLLDGRTLLALNVYLGTECGPSVPR